VRGRAVSAVLSPEVPDDKAANLALRMIQQADPPTEATVEIKTELTNEDIQKMSYSELLATAERLGIDLTRPEEGASEAASDLPIPPELAQPGDPEAE
jgi:hypothetical protein